MRRTVASQGKLVKQKGQLLVGIDMKTEEVRRTMTRRSCWKENSLVTLDTDPASKREILKSALALFVRHGPSDPTARQIAAHAGYSNPAIFKYFRTKDELALYLFKECYVKVTSRLRETIRFERPLRENLQALLTAYGEIVERDLDALLYATENHRRFQRSLSSELRERSLSRLLLQLFEDGKSEGAVASGMDTRLLVSAVIGLLSQFARARYFGEFPGPAESWVASIEEIIARTYCTRQERVGNSLR